jgi:hypothetical protein
MRSHKITCSWHLSIFTVCLLAIAMVTSFFPGLAFSGEYKMWEYDRLPGNPEGICVKRSGFRLTFDQFFNRLDQDFCFKAAY